MAASAALRWMVWGEWRAHPARVLVAAAAIAIGVALGFAVYLVNRSALDEFERAVQTVSGAADLQVRAASAAGFDETLYPTLARIPGVRAASPVVELTARASPDGPPITLLGLDVFRAAQVTPSLAGVRQGPAGAGTTPFDAGQVFLSAAAMQASGAMVGGAIRLTAAGQAASFRVAGTLPAAAEGQRIAVADIADAQWRFGQLGRLQRIDLKLAAGSDARAVQDAVAAALPPDAAIETRQTQATRGDSLSRAYRVNLEMLAMVALLTGGFLVYSAQSLSVSRREAQFALLRVLGLSRRRLLGMIFAEGGLVGLIGGMAGVGLGLALAGLALRVLGGDLGGGYFQGAHARLVFAPGAAAVFLGLGLLASLAGAVVPALHAAKAKPAVALKSAGDGVDPRARPPLKPGLALLAAGGLAALSPPVGGLPLLGYAAIALILAGGIAVMPWLAMALLTPVRPRRPGPAAHLALGRLRGAPGQAAVALCGIVASVSLMVAMSVMVASFRGSVDEWLGQVLPADLYMRLPDIQTGGLDLAAQADLTAVEGVRRVTFRKMVGLRLAADRPEVVLQVASVDRADPARSMPLTGQTRAVPVGATPVWISEPMARLYRLKPGDALTLPLGGAARPVAVAGVWRDYAHQFGAVAMDSADYTRLTGDTLRTQASVDLAPGAAPGPIIAALRAALPPGMRDQADFTRSQALRAYALRVFDRSFAVTYALEAIAIGVGLAGVAATFSAQTFARAREFGMLRHIGALRRQIVGLLALEGALLGAVGGVAGLGLGAVMGQILIQVINPQSFNWTMDTRWPVGLLTTLFCALVAASAGTAVLSGRSALSAGAIRAVREDW